MSRITWIAMVGIALAISAGPSLAQQVTPGLQKERPAQGRFVETPRGFMVPYEDKIPGTEITFTMEPIPGGVFKIGSPDGPDRDPAEGPQVEIAIKPFWMGRCEVTWAEYKQYMALDLVVKEMVAKKIRPLVQEEDAADIVTAPSSLYDPTFTFSKGGKGNQPAISMSQFAAKQYTKWLSKLSGTIYRLPTESEWEYACRAGSTTRFHFGDDPAQLGDYAWFFGNADEQFHPVGTKKPNDWGLYDMHGNAAEWVLDEFSPEHYGMLAKKGDIVEGTAAILWPTKIFPRTIRGGSYEDDAMGCRSAARRGSNDNAWHVTDPNFPKSAWWFTDLYGLSIGFRLVRSLDEPVEDFRKKMWEPDVEEVREKANSRLNDGKGSRVVPDPALLDDIKRSKAKK